jgi:hypothetical protein
VLLLLLRVRVLRQRPRRRQTPAQLEQVAAAGAKATLRVMVKHGLQ